jgi:hypothetical protein
MLNPSNDDVVIHARRGNSNVAYLLGTPATPDQLSFRSREKAVTRAVAFAKRQRVRAWFANGDDTYLLLGTFTREE